MTTRPAVATESKSSPPPVQRTRLLVVRLGVEAVAEDIEGFVEKDDAEGGARLMLGPTVALAPAGARWNPLVGGDVVTQLTSSTRPVTEGASRDLQTRNGYILRTSALYRW